jgi:hypothetical protein
MKKSLRFERYAVSGCGMPKGTSTRLHSSGARKKPSTAVSICACNPMNRQVPRSRQSAHGLRMAVAQVMM